MLSGPKCVPPSHSLSTASRHESKPVNNNIWYRYSTLLGVKILKQIRPRDGNVLVLTDKLCIKCGRRVHLSEAPTMRFRTYIVIERVKGDIIGSGWVRRSEQSKTRLLSQLKDMPPEGIGIAPVDDGSLFNCRVPGTSLRFGPFRTIQDSHRHLRMGLEFDSRLDTEVQDLLNQQNESWPSVFTQGDLSSLSILVHADNIVGIIDWETAGWYPSYWEYTSAHQPMLEDLGMEGICQKHFGAI
ncbi:kinase-like protein [Aspergillus ambiguus]|uniref:kinase-like protein n=1 Tax=Aspergillus ambiguus TaxID=176160 RepID=UPI003CCCFAE8